MDPLYCSKNNTGDCYKYDWEIYGIHDIIKGRESVLNGAVYNREENVRRENCEVRRCKCNQDQT